MAVDHVPSMLREFTYESLGFVSAAEGFVGFMCCYLLALVFFSFRHGLLSIDGEGFIEPLAAKTTLGPLRVLNFLVLAYLLSQEVLWPKNAIWVRAFAYLGRHSLQVFSFSILCVYFVTGFYDCWNFPERPVNVMVALMCAASLYLPAWAHENRARIKGYFAGWYRQLN